MQQEKVTQKARAEKIRSNRNKMKLNLKNLMLLNRKNSFNQNFQDLNELAFIRERSKTCAWKNSQLFEKNGEFQEPTSFQDFYEIKQKLGEGMHAVVYRCIQKQTKNSYAVKVLQCKSEQFYIMIRRTYNLLRSLSYPGIVQGKDLYVQQDNQVAYMVTQLIQCPTLRSYLDSIAEKRLHEKQIHNIIMSLLKTLNYLHQKQICHRDVKPENILYNPNTNQLKLVDFDIACQKKITQQRLEMWTDTGSLYYRAPQSFQSGYDEKIDVWAVGVVAYQLFTGETPFQQKLLQDTKQKIKSKQLKASIQSLFEDASPKFISFVLKLLNKDPKKRSSVKQALQDDFMNEYFSQKSFQCKSISQKLEKNSQKMEDSNMSTSIGSFQDFQKLQKAELIPRVKSKTFEKGSSNSEIDSSGQENQKNDKQKRKRSA